MSGTEYEFSLCYEPLERFEIRPSGFKISGILPGGSFWSTLSISTVISSSFDSVLASYENCLVFFSFSPSLTTPLISMDSSLSSLQNLSL